MSAAVQKLLEDYEKLPANEQLSALDEVMRRAPEDWLADLTDDDLVYAADQMFQQLDLEEARNGDAPTW